jgi:hypothetical protein
MLAASARALPIRRDKQQQQQGRMTDRPPSLLERLGSLRERLAPASAAATTNGRAGAGAAAATATATEPATAPLPQQQQQRQPQSQPTHLIVLVNGLFGSPSNWDVAAAALAAELSPSSPPPCSPSSAPSNPQPPPPLIHASTANTRTATYDGIDVCGQRLADEVRAVASRHPSLQRVTFVAHSMGGLMARFAAGALFDPRTRLVAGLEPCHFLTLATPHMGCDAEGVAQVPFVGWASKVLPAPGVAVLKGISAPVAAALFRRTGSQFFLEDGGGAAGGGGGAGGGETDLPLLARLARDDPSRGLFFLSALASFRTRTAYANVSGDHLVGWANASLRGVGELPELPKAGATDKETAAAAEGGGDPAPPWRRYVVREDPAEAAFFATDPAVGRAAALGRGRGSSQGGRWHTEEAAAAGPPRREASSALEAPDDNADDADPVRRASVEAEARAAEQDLSAGLRAASPPLAAALAAAEHDNDPHPLVGVSHPERARMVADMLLRLRALPWRRVDICFSSRGGGGGASDGGSGQRASSSSSSGGGGLAVPSLRVLGLAHNNIQVTRRLLNSEGEAVVAHLARTLREMDQALSGGEAAEAAEAAAATGG